MQKFRRAIVKQGLLINLSASVYVVVFYITYQPYGSENIEAIYILQGEINERGEDDDQIKNVPPRSKVGLA